MRISLRDLGFARCSARPGGAQTYPSQQVKLIVPFAAGAVTDFLGRLAAEHIKAKTGQTVVVENRTGAGGNPGLAQIANRRPTATPSAIAGVTSFTVNPLIYKSMPFDPSRIWCRSHRWRRRRWC